jgi:hypothetical protein
MRPLACRPCSQVPPSGSIGLTTCWFSTVPTATLPESSTLTSASSSRLPAQPAPRCANRLLLDVVAEPVSI